MDLIELQRKESRKVWIFCWLFVGACALTMVEMSDFSTDEEEDEITTCIEVLQDTESYKEDTVNYCRRLINDLIKSKMRVTT